MWSNPPRPCFYHRAIAAHNERKLNMSTVEKFESIRPNLNEAVSNSAPFELRNTHMEEDKFYQDVVDSDGQLVMRIVVDDPKDRESMRWMLARDIVSALNYNCHHVDSIRFLIDERGKMLINAGKSICFPNKDES